MEDYEAQEQEFWRKLAESGHEPLADAQAEHGRRRRLDDSLEPGVALAARRSAEADPPLKGRGFPLKTLVANAKKEASST